MGDKTEASKVDELEVPSVHSANDWESADLGDQSRKAKFLKLMGAAKKEATGKIVIGEKGDSGEHTNRTGAQVKDLEEKLAHQYEESMTSHLKHRDKRHRGLGYQGNTQVDLEAANGGTAPVVPCFAASSADVVENTAAAKRMSEGGGDEDASPSKKPRTDDEVVLPAEIQFALDCADTVAKQLAEKKKKKEDESKS